MDEALAGKLTVLAATGTAIMIATDMSITAGTVTGITATTTGIAVGTDGKESATASVAARGGEKTKSPRRACPKLSIRNRN